MKQKNKLVSFFTSWEFFLIILLILMCIVFNAQDAATQAAKAAAGKRKIVDVFNFPNVLSSMRPYFLYSFMTLGMMLILAMGDIDISVGAIGTLSVVTLGVTYHRLAVVGSMNQPTALVIALSACLLVGSLCGALNGFLITRFKELFPMIITLATQLFFRGFSYLLIGGDTLTFKDSTFKSLSSLNQQLKFFGLEIPISIPIYLVGAVFFYIWLHKTGNGRKIFAIGTNSSAAYYSGIRVDKIKFWCFVIAGMMSAVTGIFFVGNSSAAVKADIMDGYHMYAIAAAVLGGFSTDGGKGSVIGATISLVIFGVVKYGLGNVFQFPDSAVNLSVGVILILSVLVPNLVDYARSYIKVYKRRVETASSNAALEMWQSTMGLSEQVNNLVAELPADTAKTYGKSLVRASNAISSNIAEAYDKNGKLSRKNALLTARAAKNNLKAQLLSCVRMNYLPIEHVAPALECGEHVGSIINEVLGREGKRSHSSVISMEHSVVKKEEKKDYAHPVAVAEPVQAPEEIEETFEPVYEEEAAYSSEPEVLAQPEAAPVRQPVAEQEAAPVEYDEQELFENMKKSVRESLVTAQKVADGVVDDARREARKTVDDAQSEANRILSSASADSDKMRSDAQAEADRILNEAKKNVQDMEGRLDSLRSSAAAFKEDFSRMLSQQTETFKKNNGLM